MIYIYIYIYILSIDNVQEYVFKLKSYIEISYRPNQPTLTNFLYDSRNWNQNKNTIIIMNAYMVKPTS